EDVAGAVRGRAVRAGDGRQRSENGQRAAAGDVDDRQRRALVAGQVEAPPAGVVGNDVDAAAAPGGRQQLAAVLDVQRRRFPVLAADEQQAARLVQRDAARRATAG